jgi:hypothetical protein
MVVLRVVELMCKSFCCNVETNFMTFCSRSQPCRHLHVLGNVDSSTNEKPTTLDEHKKREIVMKINEKIIVCKAIYLNFHKS